MDPRPRWWSQTTHRLAHALLWHSPDLASPAARTAYRIILLGSLQAALLGTAMWSGLFTASSWRQSGVLLLWIPAAALWLVTVSSLLWGRPFARLTLRPSGLGGSYLLLVITAVLLWVLGIPSPHFAWGHSLGVPWWWRAVITGAGITLTLPLGACLAFPVRLWHATSAVRGSWRPWWRRLPAIAWSACRTLGRAVLEGAEIMARVRTTGWHDKR